MRSVHSTHGEAVVLPALRRTRGSGRRAQGYGRLLLGAVAGGSTSARAAPAARTARVPLFDLVRRAARRRVARARGPDFGLVTITVATNGTSLSYRCHALSVASSVTTSLFRRCLRIQTSKSLNSIRRTVSTHLLLAVYSRDSGVLAV